MPVTSAAPTSRPNITTTSRATISTSIIKTSVPTLTYTSAQSESEVTPTTDNQPTNKTFLGTPSLNGAYKYITIIIICNAAFLLFFTVFTILICKKAKRTKNGHSQHQTVELKPINTRQNNTSEYSFKTLDRDQVSITSLTRTRDHEHKTNQSGPPSPNHAIRCYSQSSPSNGRSFNNDGHYVHTMYGPQQIPGPRSARPSSEIDPSASSPNKYRPSNTASQSHYSHDDKPRAAHAQPQQLLQDGEHSYVINKPLPPPARPLPPPARLQRRRS